MKTVVPPVMACLGCLFVLAQSGRAQVNISFEYTFDTGFLSGNATAQADLQAAANALAGRLTDSLSAITPSGQNSWSATFSNPTTGTQQSVNNLSVPANTIVIYIGARDLGASTLGLGGFGGFNASGTQSWADLISQRGQAGAPNTDFGPWGGSISFNNTTSWYFDSDPSTVDVPGGQSDFYSVALHELGHVLGIGTATSWNNKISGGQFTGAASVAAHGGTPVPLDASGGHWANGTTSTLPGTSTLQEAAMDPSLTVGTRKLFTDLDFAGLTDVGWQVTPVPEPEQYALVAALGLLSFLIYRRRLLQTP